MNTTDQIRTEATQRLMNSLDTIVKLALISYRKQSLQYRKFASVDRHVRTVVQMTYKGFVQEVKAELSRPQQAKVTVHIEVSTTVNA